MIANWYSSKTASCYIEDYNATSKANELLAANTAYACQDVLKAARETGKSKYAVPGSITLGHDGGYGSIGEVLHSLFVISRDEEYKHYLSVWDDIDPAKRREYVEFKPSCEFYDRIAHDVAGSAEKAGSPFNYDNTDAETYCAQISRKLNNVKALYVPLESDDDSAQPASLLLIHAFPSRLNDNFSRFGLVYRNDVRHPEHNALRYYLKIKLA